MKATFDLDADLYRAIRVEAARADRSVREVVEEALEGWLARAEEAEDRASAEGALAEYRRDGGESAEAWFAKVAAETRAAYATDVPSEASKPPEE
jgi:Arc/MetJ-type ribon-helix-helix transcriptional regulator